MACQGTAFRDMFWHNHAKRIISSSLKPQAPNLRSGCLDPSMYCKEEFQKFFSSCDPKDAAPSDTFKKSGEADDVDETDAAPHEESRKESEAQQHVCRAVVKCSLRQIKQDFPHRNMQLTGCLPQGLAGPGSRAVLGLDS